MATEILLKKMYDSFVPLDVANLELMESMKFNGEYRATFTQPRNLPFFRKFWAMLDFAYDAFEPAPIMYKGIAIGKNKERFRKDMIIVAGFHDAVINIDGKLRLEAKSISFANMSEESFELMYSAVINAVLDRVLTNYKEDELRLVVDKCLGFA